MTAPDVAARTAANEAGRPPGVPAGARLVPLAQLGDEITRPDNGEGGL